MISVSNRISTLYASEAIFNSHALYYNVALAKAGYNRKRKLST